MRNLDFFKNKKVTVIGLARSGLACANLLFSLGAEVSVTDNQDNQTTRQNASKLISKKIKFELGAHTREFISDRDMIVLSPGVTQSSLPVVWAGEENIPVVNEIEVGFILCSAPIIAVTGSTGKTTVTTLIGKMIEAWGRKAFVCGNIGDPFTGVVDKINPQDFVCLEVSSFQLETTKDFKPKISLILNLSKNHLDRHKDMQEYLDAKKKIFANQDLLDFLILNEDDPNLKKLSTETKAKVVYFGGKSGINPNQSALMAVGSILGISQELAQEVFKNFLGLEHRLEYVTQVNKINFINDSKSTVVESTVWAINNIPGKIILIAGGKDKGVDYSGILPAAKNKVKKVILIGEAKNKIKNALAGFLPVEEALNLEDAVSRAFNQACADDTVILSPMCSSFDMFTNYQERGQAFKKLVSNLKEKSMVL